MRRCYLPIAGFLLALSWSSLLPAEPLTVYTVNYPLQYFAQRIAGDHARVMFPAPPDVDPAFWMPDRETIGDYQRADLILLNGAAYARWISKASLPRLRLVDTSRAFSDDLVAVRDTVTHNHGPAGKHSHTGTAFTTWLDLHQAVQQARAIADALSRRQPEHRSDFEKNFATLRSELMALEQTLQQTVAANPGQRLFTSHPIYQYLARRYGLRIEDMVWEPDEMPDEQQWQQLRQLHENYPADWMLWEKQPLPEVAQQLDTMGIGIAVFDPCANRPASGDFLSVMQDNITSLGQAYTNQATPRSRTAAPVLPVKPAVEK